MRASKSGLNILIAEDNVGDARLVTELLKKIDIGQYNVTYIRDIAEIAEFDGMNFSIILLDLHLSDTTPPIETYKQAYKAFPSTPIVILTGLKDDQLASKIVRLGAQDYLIKGTFGPSTLKRSITYSIDRKKSALRLAHLKSKSRQLEVRTTALEDETKRLEALNNAKDVFVSIASHQLRTPATSVKQYLGMLLEGFAGSIPDEQKHFLEVAYKSNERQLKIIEDLLKVARLEAGKVTLHKSSVRINEFLQTIVDDLTPSFTARNQKLVFTPLYKELRADIDESNMRMVFENILDNASKYSPEHTKIEIRVSHRKDRLVVEVSDQGIGISKTDISMLFHKFSRIDKSFTHSPDGSGLGLYWAQEIVKLHGGIIHLKSTPKEGSTFGVDIPCDSLIESPDRLSSVYEDDRKSAHKLSRMSGVDVVE